MPDLSPKFNVNRFYAIDSEAVCVRVAYSIKMPSTSCVHSTVSTAGGIRTYTTILNCGENPAGSPNIPPQNCSGEVTFRNTFLQRDVEELKFLFKEEGVTIYSTIIVLPPVAETGGTTGDTEDDEEVIVMKDKPDDEAG